MKTRLAQRYRTHTSLSPYRSTSFFVPFAPGASDAERRKRIKTVELIEEEAEWAPPGVLYLVQIDWPKTALREKAKSFGGRWNPARRLWMMPRETVRALSAEDRIRAWLEPE